MTDLTAIITCKNRTENLGYCLGSIDVCSPRPDCILVDFGNEIPLHKYAKVYPWLTVIRAVNDTDLFHKTRALNIGIKAAKTKYVCLTDTDQIFQPNFFGIVLAELTKGKKRFIRCKTFFSTFQPAIPPTSMNWLRYRQFLSKVKQRQIKDPHGEGCCHGVSRAWLMSVNGHDEQYIGWGYEDKDLVLRARAAGFTMVWIDDQTSMVHLPHKRNKNYFKFTHINRNKDYFNKKRGNVRVKVNSNRKWGVQ